MSYMNKAAQDNKRQDNDEKINQRKVQTPYGEGLVLSTRSSTNNNDTAKVKTTKKEENNAKTYEVQLSSWKLSNNTYPKLYTCTNLPSVRPQIDDDVICTYGRGTVVSSSPTNNNNDSINKNSNNMMYHIEFTSWKLNGRSKVHGYINESSLSVVRPKETYEMTPYERILYSYKQKQKATIYFSKHKDYKNALTYYTKAVNALRYVEYDTSCDNDLRCDLIELMITCSNNAATCSMKMIVEKNNEGDCLHNANKFAMNALVLLDALYTKRGLKIHTALLKKGISDYKLFGEWKCKSILFCVRYCMHKNEYNDAIDKLKHAKGIIETYKKEDDSSSMMLKSMNNLEKEINKFMSICLKKKKEMLKKEKARAQAMFGNASKKSSNKVTTTNTTETNKKKENNKDANNKGKEDFRNENNIKSVESTTPNTKEINGILQHKIKNNDTSSPNTKSLKSVSFDNNENENYIYQEEYDEDEYEEQPWYSQHKEALIVTGLGCLSIAGMMFLRGGNKK